MITPIATLLNLKPQDLKKVEFFRPNGDDQAQVLTLCTEDTNESPALEGAVVKKVMVSAPVTVEISRRIIPSHQVSARKIYFLVSGQAEVVVGKKRGADYVSFRLSHCHPVIVPPNRTHAMVFSGPAAFIVITLSSHPEVRWQVDIENVLANSHLSE